MMKEQDNNVRRALQEEALLLHEKWQGKIEVVGKAPTDSQRDLALAYTPGVAEPCKKIYEEKEMVYKYTMKSNTIMVATDGSAVLGLGNIGPEAALPVMEGKALLFKNFAGVNAVPICVATQDVEEFVRVIKLIAPAFGGVNLEDIAAPRCFIIEERLQNELNIPVFHDDQHGTAIVVLAALTNALKVVKKDKSVRIVVNGAGSAGCAIARLLLVAGFKNIILCDKQGILNADMADLNFMQRRIVTEATPHALKGPLQVALDGADVFIGVSAGGILQQKDIALMAPRSIVFAMANPEPEIYPHEALAGGAMVVGTGRSDFPNQVNNVLAFPGIFKGLLACRALRVTDAMKLAAAEAIANCVSPSELSPQFVLPYALNRRVAEQVAAAVVAAYTQGE